MEKYRPSVPPPGDCFALLAPTSSKRTNILARLLCYMAVERVEIVSEHLTASPSSTMSTIQQLFGLEGKTALVTGSTRGIGQAMAIALAESGADVLLVQVGLSSIPYHLRRNRFNQS